ncbi:Glucose 1-dehydrogenase 1 [Poriferisphaera corsica]|uniref:Glucose 1-dehydrogenase 1 n=1 Tax=Poriferisphaera corsica TaxID=2528020 RepID=A0A517YQK1_9BACT|nr:SDR family oxidoreductase [Poriferisphaera corsica]QDU32494.1 Glucose 1-dehydrogenase 1 [Poriferisphaera corsica]
MPKRLDGKIAFLTGGNSGIGLATAKEFAKQGATVVILARSQEKADRALAEIGGESEAVIGDVTDLGSLEIAYSMIREKYGRLDIVFANAGIVPTTPLGEVSVSDFDQMSDVNFKGTFFTVQYAFPLLTNNASVILVSSCLDEMGAENYSLYNATKAAIRSLARSLTPDLARKGARINVLSPGPIDTPVLENSGMSDEQIHTHKQAFANVLAAGRVGEPEEMAKTALFMASDDSSFMFGSEIQADGGMNQMRIAMQW